MDLKEKIRVIENYPKPGISFKDITPLLNDGEAFGYAIDQLAAPFKPGQIDLIVGPEARGFLVGAPLAYKLNVGFVPVRKKGKLPSQVVQYTYSLEYGEDTLEIHADAIKPGQKVLIADDLLATGGTISAAIELIQQLGGEVVGLAFLIELTFLDGRKRLTGDYQIHSLLKY